MASFLQSYCRLVTVDLEFQELRTASWHSKLVQARPPRGLEAWPRRKERSKATLYISDDTQPALGVRLTSDLGAPYSWAMHLAGGSYISGVTIAFRRAVGSGSNPNVFGVYITQAVESAEPDPYLAVFCLSPTPISLLSTTCSVDEAISIPILDLHHQIYRSFSIDDCNIHSGDRDCLSNHVPPFFGAATWDQGAWVTSPHQLRS